MGFHPKIRFSPLLIRAHNIANMSSGTNPQKPTPDSDAATIGTIDSGIEADAKDRPNVPATETEEEDDSGGEDIEVDVNTPDSALNSNLTSVAQQ
jgi:hypothetical protein